MRLGPERGTKHRGSEYEKLKKKKTRPGMNAPPNQIQNEKLIKQYNTHATGKAATGIVNTALSTRGGSLIGSLQGKYETNAKPRTGAGKLASTVGKKKKRLKARVKVKSGIASRS